MKKLLITEYTIAIKKEDNNTIIYDIDHLQIVKQKISNILKFNCNFYGSNLNKRINSAKCILNISYKAPIIVDECKNIILIQINSLRSKECLLVAFNKIVNYYEKENSLIIECVNNNIFEVKITKNCFEKELLNAIKLNHFLLLKNSKMCLKGGHNVI